MTMGRLKNLRSLPGSDITPFHQPSFFKTLAHSLRYCRLFATSSTRITVFSLTSGVRQARRRPSRSSPLISFQAGLGLVYFTLLKDKKSSLASSKGRNGPCQDEPLIKSPFSKSLGGVFFLGKGGAKKKTKKAPTQRLIARLLSLQTFPLAKGTEESPRASRKNMSSRVA